MRLIDADALLEILKREEAYLRKNQADERADGILDAIMDAEDAPTIEPKAYDEIAKIIVDASFTGDDGLDYVETLVVLNAIKGDKTGDRRMSEIKPCPHCGWILELFCDDDQYKIYCMNPDCDASYGWCADKEYLIKGWNRRVKNE